MNSGKVTVCLLRKWANNAGDGARIPCLVPTCLELYLYLGGLDTIFLQSIDVKLLRMMFPEYATIYGPGVVDWERPSTSGLSTRHGTTEVPTFSLLFGTMFSVDMHLIWLDIIWMYLV